MKHLALLFLLVIVCVMNSCIGYYSDITHLTDDDLKWTDYYNVGDTIFFHSDNMENVDTMMVIDKRTYNRKNRFFIHYIDNYFGDRYEANSGYYYVIISGENQIDGDFGIKKFIDCDSIFFSAYLGSLFTNGLKGFSNSYRPISTDSCNINGDIYDNCIIVDDKNAHYINDSRIIDKFIITQNYGLIYYRYTNGTEFFRKFD